MVVQGDDAGQPPRHADGPQQPGVGARAVADRPGDFLPGNAVPLPGPLDGDILRLRGAGRERQRVPDGRCVSGPGGASGGTRGANGAAASTKIAEGAEVGVVLMS